MEEIENARRRRGRGVALAIGLLPMISKAVVGLVKLPLRRQQEANYRSQSSSHRVKVVHRSETSRQQDN